MSIPFVATPSWERESLSRGATPAAASVRAFDEAARGATVEAAVRAGIAVYVTPEDVDRLISAVQRL